MNVRDTIRASLRLLSKRDRRILGVTTLAQMSTAFLDLFGVLLIGIVTALSVAAVGGGTPPTVVTTLLDRLGLGDVDPVTLTIALGVTAGIVLITKSAINVFLTRRVLRFLANRQAIVSGRLAAGLLSRPLLQVQRRSSQETAYALTAGVNFATLTILGLAVVAVSELSLLIVLAIGLLAISPVVTVFSIAFFLIVALFLQRILSGWAGRLGERVTQTEVSSYSIIQESLRTYREAVVANRRGTYVRRFQDLRWQSALLQSDLQFIALAPKYVFEVALVVGAGVLAASQLLTKDATAAAATIAVFLAAGSRIVPSMLRLQGAAITVRSVSGQAAPAFELSDELASVDGGRTTANTLGAADAGVIRRRLEVGHGDFQPTISISDVDLTYPQTMRAALEGISLELEAGSSLALVGPTGAGKSTLADVILGVLEPDSGVVLIGGIQPGAAVGRWPGGLAYVPQDVAMANGTVRENVALGLPKDAIDDSWVWDALERAHLAEFLRSSREGIDTIIGENGIKLSGGQRQRLGVARALYTRPLLLVLDEATSALDAETEQAIAATLRGLEGSVTTVTVAHRLATIRHCDMVVYLEDGRILASGSFDDVRRNAPHFDQQAQLLGL